MPMAAVVIMAVAVIIDIHIIIRLRLWPSIGTIENPAKTRHINNRGSNNQE